MPFNYKDDLANLLKLAGINGAEAARLFKVTRTSIYNWMKGEGPHQELVQLYAERQIALVKKAIAAGDLPLKEVAPADRKNVLAAVLRKHV